MLYRAQVAAQAPTTGIVFGCAAQVIQVIHHEVQSNVLAQFFAPCVNAQGVYLLTQKTFYASGAELDIEINQLNFRHFAVFAEQLQINIGPAGCDAGPYRATQKRLECLQPAHPTCGQQAQSVQFLGLLLRAKHRDVLLDRALQQSVVGQRTAPGQVQLRQRLAFGAAEVQPFFHHQPRGNRCDFFLGPVHAAIVPCQSPTSVQDRT